MNKQSDSRQLPLNLGATNSVKTNNKHVQNKKIETASVLKFSTKAEQKNNSELKQLYIRILKGVEHIK